MRKFWHLYRFFTHFVVFAAYRLGLAPAESFDFPFFLLGFFFFVGMKKTKKKKEFSLAFCGVCFLLFGCFFFF